MEFTSQVSLLKKLKAFLLAEAVDIRKEDADLFSLGPLTDLQYGEKGRRATVEEWQGLDERTRQLNSYLDDELRKRFQLKQTANLLAGLSAAFLIFALVSLLVGAFADYRNVPLVCYLIWTVCLGAMGPIAFLSMNTLSIQTDVTFDLTNQSLLAVRIILGALFGVVLSVPFGFYGFVTFIASFGRGTPDLGAETVVGFGMRAVLLLLPFILGFSTALVILVLNRFVESLRVFFGDRP